MPDKQDTPRSIVAQAADRLQQAVRTATPIAPMRDLLEKTDVTTAYAIQALVTARERAAGRRICGRKIGLTSPAVQRQMGVFEPDYGALFADTEFGSNQEIPYAGLIHPRCEAEVALVLDKDIRHDMPTFSDVARAIAYVTPAIEVVDSRIVNWEHALSDTIADSAAARYYVVGDVQRRLVDCDLPAVRMTLHRNGAQASHGRGLDCMGHPLNAAVWLIRKMREHGLELSAGDVILTGALGPMVPVFAGDAISVAIEGLGTVSTRFSAST